MEVDLGKNPDPPPARCEATETQGSGNEPRSTMSNESGLITETSNVSSSQLVPEMISAQLAPLELSRSHTVTTVEVTKDSTNVDKDETLSNSAYPVYVKSLHEAEEVLHRFENDTKTRFSVWRCPKDFGNSQIDLANKRIYWQEFDIGDKITVKSDGVPFIMMGRKVYDCHFGKDRNVRLKEKMRIQREESETEATRIRKAPPSRKLDCPAKIVLCEIIYFPDFKIAIDTKYYRGNVAKKMKERFAAGSIDMRTIERRIYISFPTSDEHIGHPTTFQSTNLVQRMDPKISKKLSELVLSGVRNEKQMKEQLEKYINCKLYPGKAKPFHSNKRYFPNLGVIRTKMYNECVLQRLMVLDCGQVSALVARLRDSHPEDMLYTHHFEGMSDFLTQGTLSVSMEELLEDEIRVRQKLSQQQFIFVHQTSFQRHLLKRYGNHVCFLDPVYRTVKYPLPLFFLMVKTNVDYQVVATFVVQDENKESTKEALEFIKSWNPEWKPKVLMVDNDSEEILALQEVFTDCKVFLSDFHREQAWRNWLSQACNDVVAHKNAILASLRRIAQAKSVREFEKALESLTQTDCWQNDHGKIFKHWFEEKWLSIKKCWVVAYQKPGLCDLVMKNHPFERQTKDFTHGELMNQGGTPMSNVLKMIVESILPEKRDFYVEQNARNEDNKLPRFYQSRPRGFATHTAECLRSVNEYTADDIVVNSLARKELLVKSSHSDVEYKVHFGNDFESPHCECEDWSKTMMPCTHFLAIMRHFKKWNWSSFPENYRNSPYLTLDPSNDQNCAEEPIGRRTSPSGSRADNESMITADSLCELLQEKEPGLKSTAGECRHLLDDITNMTFLIQDKKVLATLHSQLQETLESLRRSAVDDDVIFGQSSEAIKSGNNKVYPVRSSKRAGDWSGQGTTPSKVAKVDDDGTSSGCKISQQDFECGDGTNTEHYRTLNGNAGTSRGFNGDMRITPGVMNGDVSDNVQLCVSTTYNNETSKGTNSDVMPSEVDDSPQLSTENLSDPPQMKTSQSHDSENETCLEMSFSEVENSKDETTLYSSPAGTLSKYEERVITKREVVPHTTINLAQTFLREEFPDIRGLQNVARGPIQTFKHVSGDFIQILQDGGDHWVCASNAGLVMKEAARVNMYDSMNQGFIAKFIKQQIASFMCIQNAEMKVIMKSVQQQTSPVDCGVFAIAFATALAFGQDPSKQRFEVTKMRAHLVECLKLKKMSPFPEMKPGFGSDVVVCRRKYYTVELFCSCRMPYEKPKSEADLMAQCGSCKEWFHQRCESLKASGHGVVCGACQSNDG